MNDELVLDTARGRVTLRPEREDDTDFLYALFHSHTLAELTLMPVDTATKERLVRMQFASQTTSYRAQFPQARFDIIERDTTPIGRLIVNEDTKAGCVVDFALMPEYRGGGLGTAILASVLQRQSRPVLCKVLCTNEASIRMCRRAGFVQIGAELPFLQLEWRPPAAGSEG